MQARRHIAVLVLALASAACAGAGAGPREAAGGAEELAVRRGDFRERLLLTGELVAPRADELGVPRTPVWQLQIRWMEKDGTPVAAGQPVVEFDSSSFTSDLEERRISAREAESGLARVEVDVAATTAEKEFTVAQKQADLEKAKIDAAVPRDLLALRTWQERQLALERAELELAKAREDLAAHRRASAAEIAIQRVTLEKTRREIATAERAVQVLTLTAPRAGIVVAAEHPWERRKLQTGDTAWVGMVVVRIPDLSSMAIEAALSDVDDGRIAPGMAVVATLDTYPEQSFTGRIVAVSPVAREPLQGSPRRAFKVDVALDRTDPERMRPGMSAKVEVLGAGRRGVLLAPRAALDLTAAPPRARLAAGGEKEVRLGPCGALECVVESGLAEGERLRSHA